MISEIFPNLTDSMVSKVGRCWEEFTGPVEGASCLVGAGTAQNGPRGAQGPALPAVKGSS